MNINKQMEFDRVKEIWTGLALTDWVKEQIKQVSICFSENELKSLLGHISGCLEYTYYKNFVDRSVFLRLCKI